MKWVSTRRVLGVVPDTDNCRNWAFMMSSDLEQVGSALYLGLDQPFLFRFNLLTIPFIITCLGIEKPGVPGSLPLSPLSGMHTPSSCPVVAAALCPPANPAASPLPQLFAHSGCETAGLLIWGLFCEVYLVRASEAGRQIRMFCGWFQGLMLLSHDKGEVSIFWNRVRKTEQCPLTSRRRDGDSGENIHSSQSRDLPRPPPSHCDSPDLRFLQGPSCCSLLGSILRSSENSHLFLLLIPRHSLPAAGTGRCGGSCLITGVLLY